MTELKRSMAALEEIQKLLACYLSEGRQEGAGNELCTKIADLDVRVRAIEARYNKSVQNNNSIYGPVLTPIPTNSVLATELKGPYFPTVGLNEF